MKELFQVRLKALRKEKLKTQQDVAAALGVGRSTIAEYERGNIEPSAKMIDALASYFDVSADYLMGNTNFHTHDEKIEAPKDVKDIAKQVKLMIDALNDAQTALMFDGEELDSETRQLMASSFENSLNFAYKLNKKG